MSTYEDDYTTTRRAKFAEHHNEVQQFENVKTVTPVSVSIKKRGCTGVKRKSSDSR